MLGPWSEYFTRLPKSENDLILGDPWKLPDRFIEAYAVPIGCRLWDNKPFAYPIHERCWVLMTHILDADLIKTHLDLFVKAFRRTYVNRKLYNLDNKICDDYEWEELEEYYGDMFIENPDKYLARLEKQMECSEKRHALRDPWKVVEIRNLIKAGIHREAQKRRPNEHAPVSSILNNRATTCPYIPTQGKIENKKRLDVLKSKPCHQMILRSSSTLDGEKIILPAELILLIMDQLSNSREIRYLLWVFPHWDLLIPRSYWRTRFVKDLMLDYKEVPSLDVLDWKGLYFQIDEVFEKSHGLRNRKRIMKVLEKVKKLFFGISRQGGT